jgi:polyhydroxybutyrate depolymerase
MGAAGVVGRHTHDEEGRMRAIVWVVLLGMIACACAGPSGPSRTTDATSRSEPSDASASVGRPCDAPAGVSSDVSWTIAGSQRSARVHRSTAADAGPAPVVVALHGYGGFGLELEQISGLSDAADARGWVVVYPEGTGTTQAWADLPGDSVHATDVAFLRQIVDTLAVGGCGDPTRVVLAGISQGGWLADLIACEQDDLMIAVVAVAAREFPGWPCIGNHPVAFAAVNGVLDEVIPYAGGPVNGVNVRDAESVDAWLAARAATRDCDPTPQSKRASQHVEVTTWSGCSAPVTLYRVEDGGHSWPGGGGLPPVDRELSVTDIIAKMLEPKP